jgi:hypothetical protein
MYFGVVLPESPDNTCDEFGDTILPGGIAASTTEEVAFSWYCPKGSIN